MAAMQNSSSKPIVANEDAYNGEENGVFEHIKTFKRMSTSIPQRKLDFAEKLGDLLDEYDTCLVIQINNIGSKQIAEIRKELRGRARFLFGKNSLFRKVIRDYVKKTENTKLMKLMDLIKGNCGLVFIKQDIEPICKQIIQSKKQSPAKCGAIAPTDVYLPAGPTNMEPTKTHIFQAMDIETRINRGQIDITAPKHLIKKGSKVGASEAFLLSQLNIKPFWYRISVEAIYDKGEVIKDCPFMQVNEEEISPEIYSGLPNIAEDPGGSDIDDESSSSVVNPFDNFESSSSSSEGSSSEESSSDEEN